MKFDPDQHHRRSIRMQGYDYSQVGVYFVTVCTYQRECLFGDVVDGEMRLNECGEIVASCWGDVPLHFQNIERDAFIVMPNHVHGIVVITDVGAQHAAPLHAPHRTPSQVAPGSLGVIVRSFKSAVTKQINTLRGTPGAPVWQRNYYDHVIRNEKSLNAIRRYIQNNPLLWLHDRDNPDVAHFSLKVRDRVLAKHYGFTGEELDFIINYDIEYRMGSEGEG